MVMRATFGHCPYGRAVAAAPAWHPRGDGATCGAAVQHWGSLVGQAWRTDAFLWWSMGLAHRWTRVDELHTLPAHLTYVIARSAWKLHGGLLPQNRLAQPIGLRPSVGTWPAESRVVPERWAGAREPLPAPAARLAAAMPRVHCRRAARPPSLHPIGPERASSSALSLPDPHPTLARAGVLLVAAAARRPPICHRPQPGADKPWRRRRRRRSWHC